MEKPQPLKTSYFSIFFQFIVFCLVFVFSAPPVFAGSNGWENNISCDFPLFTEKDLKYAQNQLEQGDPDGSWNLGNDVWGRALKWALRGDKQAGDQAVQEVLGFWIDKPGSSRSRDDYRWNAPPIIRAFGLVKNLMTPEEYNEFVDRMFDYIQRIAMYNEWGTPSQPGNNYSDTNFNTSFQFALIVACSHPEIASEIINHDMNERWPNYLDYYAGSAKGGEPDEGTQYADYSTRFMPFLFPTLRQYGLDLFSPISSWLAERAAFAMYATSPGPNGIRGYYTQPSRGEDDRNSYPPAGPPPLSTYMQMAVNEYGETKLGQLSRHWLNLVGNGVDWWPFLLDSGGPELSFDKSLPTEYFAPGTQTFLTRSSWDPNGAMSAVIFGAVPWTSSSHNNFDAGSIADLTQCDKNGECYTLLKDSNGYYSCMGGGIGTNQRRTLAHNSIVLGYEDQGQAERNAAGNGVTLAIDHTDALSLFSVDLTGAYKNENPYVDKLIRQIVNVKGWGLIVVDHIITKDADNLTAEQVPATILFHMPMPPKVDDKNRVVTEENGNAVLNLNTLLPSSDDPDQKVDISVTDLSDFEDTQDCHHEGDRGFYNHLVKVTTSGARDRFVVHFLQTKIKGEPDILASAGIEGRTKNESAWVNMELKLNSAWVNVELKLNKGEKSKQGLRWFSFNQDDPTEVWYAYSPDPDKDPTEAIQFSDHVRQISVTWEDGVTWGKGPPSNSPPREIRGVLPVNSPLSDKPPKEIKGVLPIGSPPFDPPKKLQK